MSPVAHEVLQSALALPADEREQLIAILSASLEPRGDLAALIEASRVLATTAAQREARRRSSAYPR